MDDAFEQMLELEKVRQEWARVESEYVKRMVEAEILVMEREGKREKVLALRALADQAERNIRSARQAEVELEAKRARYERLDQAARRLLRGQRLADPSDEWRAFWELMRPSVIDSLYKSTERLVIGRDDFFGSIPDATILPQKPSAVLAMMRAHLLVPKFGTRCHEWLVSIYRQSAEAAQREAALVQEKLEALRAGRLNDWRISVDRILESN
jgi:hypothetical protein